jgi:hypothetical protein
VDRHIVDKLRRDQSLHELPDGRQGVCVTLQFVGAVPRVARAERKDWLERQFVSVQFALQHHLELKPDSLSVSGQSIDAVVPVDELDEIRDRLSREDVRVELTRTVNVLESTE